MTDEPDLDLNLDAVFPEAPRPPSPPATLAIYTREPRPERPHDEDSQSQQVLWSEIQIRLVGSHPLWGHYLWNAARAFASYLDDHPELYRDGYVLELGAGGGLPGIVTAKNGARKTVLTDYPDTPLIDNLQHNIDLNLSESERGRVDVQGYVWGQSVEPLLVSTETASDGPRGFDLIILSDLVFNHSQHDALLKTCEAALAPVTASCTPCVLVFYTHHRPQYALRDLDFFTKAVERGWNCEEILTRKYPPMFPEDPGEEEVRAIVHGWKLYFAK